MIGLIVACEVGFWVLLGGGLAARYLLRAPRLSTVLLLAVPLVDVVLLVASVLDLRGGAAADVSHGLAAVYLACTVVFGHRMVRWADQRVAFRFAGGPVPQRPPRTGPEHAAHERRSWLRHLAAYLLGAVVLAVFSLLVGDPGRTAPLWSVMGTWTLVLAIDFVISFSYTLSPRRRGA